MPKNNQTARTARKARKRADGRKNQPGNGRAQGGQPTKDSPKVLAGTVHSLKLQPIPGARFLQQRSSVANNLVTDLKICLGQITGRSIKLPAGTFEDQVAGLLSELKSATKNFNVAIHEEDGRFQVHIFQTCPYPDCMPVMFVGPALERLSKQPMVKRLFMDFLHLFLTTTRIDTWFWGTMDQARDEIEGRIQYDKDAYDPDDYQCMVQTLDYYKKGGPDDHAKRLAKACKVKLPQLLRRIKRCRIPRLKKVMLEGCKLLQEGIRVDGFDYYPDTDDYEYHQDGLRFSFQSAILWRTGDDLCSVFDEFIDMYVQSGGVCDPFVCEVVRPDKRKAVDVSAMLKRRSWPRQLANFLEHGNDLLNQFANNHLLINNLFEDAECDARNSAIIEA